MLTEMLATGAAALALPGTLYLGCLSVAALLHRRARSPLPAPCGHTLRVAVVIPAHNEEKGIARTLLSLQRERHQQVDTRLVVIADNCTDRTAAIAAKLGAEVLERHDTEHRGKGYALAHAFEKISQVDWFIIVDADTDVAPGFLVQMRAAMRTGADALQCRYLVRDPMASARSKLAEVALSAWNVLRPRGRAAMGLSTGILGNGFALSRATLDRVPYSAHSIVEDAEYHLLLLQSGLRVSWVDDATVRGDMPESAQAEGTQRARWEGGRLRLACERLPGLFKQVLRGHLRMLDPCADLLLLPLAQHCCLLLLALAGGPDWVQMLASVGLACVALHVVIALRITHAPLALWQALLGAPLYVLRKLLLTRRIVHAASRNATWVRTARDRSEGAL